MHGLYPTLSFTFTVTRHYSLWINKAMALCCCSTTPNSAGGPKTSKRTNEQLVHLDLGARERKPTHSKLMQCVPLCTFATLNPTSSDKANRSRVICKRAVETAKRRKWVHDRAAITRREKATRGQRSTIEVRKWQRFYSFLFYFFFFFFLSLELTIYRYELPLDKIQYERGEKGDY